MPARAGNTTIDAFGPDLAELRTIITRNTARSAAGGWNVVLITSPGPIRVAADRVPADATEHY